MACDTDGRFAVGRRRGGTGLASHGGPSCQNPVERWAREVLLGSRWCPAGYGCRRLTSAVCGEYARKFVGGSALALVTGSQSVVCKSIAKASKVRILHLPPRAESAPELRKRRSGALSWLPAETGCLRLFAGNAPVSLATFSVQGRARRLLRLLPPRRSRQRQSRLDALPRNLILAVHALGIDL